MARPKLPALLRMAVLGIALFTLAACSGGDDVPSTPAAATVQSFYDHLNAGRLEDAKKLYNAEAHKVIFEGEGAADRFREWAVSETQDGSVRNVTVLTTTDGPDGVTIEYQVTYSNGTKVTRRVTLNEEAGGWRMGFIG